MDTEWHRITYFNGLGKTVADNCEKGMKVMVHGRIHYGVMYQTHQGWRGEEMTPQLNVGWRIVGVLQRTGEHLMMDFGLSGLLDRIERDFGAKTAKALTTLIAIAIVAGCLTLIGNLISSFFVWLSGITSESTIWGQVFYVGKYLVGFALLIAVANNFAHMASARAYQAVMQGHAQEASDLVVEAREGDAMLQENIALFGDVLKKLAAETEDKAAAETLRGMHERVSQHRQKREP